MTKHTAAIEVAGLTKSYADHALLRGIYLTVPAGTVYVLLGPNGAGKTTMARILTTLTPADAEQAGVAGFDVRREPDGVGRSIGVTGQFSAIDELLAGRENLRLMADLAHLRTAEARARVDELLALVDLTDVADRRAATYSGGMKRRLDLPMTLVSRPRFIAARWPDRIAEFMVIKEAQLDDPLLRRFLRTIGTLSPVRTSPRPGWRRRPTCWPRWLSSRRSAVSSTSRTPTCPTAPSTTFSTRWFWPPVHGRSGCGTGCRS